MEGFIHIASHVVEHSVSDTLYLIPFLFVTYVAMEWLEHRTAGKTQEAIQRAGAAGPVMYRSIRTAERTEEKWPHGIQEVCADRFWKK